MILTDSTLPGYLHEFGLLRGLRVTGVRSSVGRSYCAGVVLSDGQQWFVKQARLGPDGLTLADLDREAAVLGWASAASSGRSGEALRRLLPGFRLHDAENRVLVTDYLSAHRPLAGASSRSLLGRGVAVGMARHLGRLHAVTPESVVGANALPTAPEPPAAIWEEVGPETIAAQPDAFAELIQQVQETPGLAESLARIRASWTPSSLIHGDLKRDNILWRPRRAPAPADLRLIDWELAHWGDPTWDAGSAVGDYLHGWLATISPTRTGGLNDWIAAASIPYPRIQAAISTFWMAYRHARGLTPREAAALTPRVIVSAGTFLVHRALAAAMTHGTVTSGALCTLQVACRFLRAPDDAARGVLP